MNKFLLIGLISLLGLPSQALVFDMGKEKFGAYLRGTFLPSWGGATDPFGQSSGSNVAFNGAFTNVTSYEFGFLFNGGPVTYRVGFELIQPPGLSGVNGTNASGSTTYYSMNSQMTVYMPKVGLEFNLKTWKESRLWLYGEYGSANIAVQNSYQLTAAGNAQFPGVSNFREVVVGYQNAFTGTLGFETLVSDTSTICLELGYRSLDFSSLNEQAAVTDFQGAQGTGAAALQNNGTSPRNINLSGAFAALMFRIWVY